jgi:hypothetical protein
MGLCRISARLVGAGRAKPALIRRPLVRAGAVAGAQKCCRTGLLGPIRWFATRQLLRRAGLCGSSWVSLNVATGVSVA